MRSLLPKKRKIVRNKVERNPLRYSTVHIRQKILLKQRETKTTDEARQRAIEKKWQRICRIGDEIIQKTLMERRNNSEVKPKKSRINKSKFNFDEEQKSSNSSAPM